MPGPPAKKNRRRRNTPAAGEWQHAPGDRWMHGRTPKPPTGLLKATREAWDVWFGSWFASFWTPEDLPGIRMVARLYDQVERGEYQRHSELRLAMSAYGMHPEGQQKRRWMRATEAEITPLRAVSGDRPVAVDPG